jgi:hypothetical protein
MVFSLPVPFTCIFTSLRGCRLNRGYGQQVCHDYILYKPQLVNRWDLNFDGVFLILNHFSFKLPLFNVTISII